jgi:hypothetical protein
MLCWAVVFMRLAAAVHCRRRVLVLRPLGLRQRMDKHTEEGWCWLLLLLLLLLQADHPADRQAVCCS